MIVRAADDVLSDVNVTPSVVMGPTYELLTSERMSNFDEFDVGRLRAWVLCT